MKFTVDHISVQTKDFENAFTFYTELLGFKVITEPFNFKTRKLCLLDAGKIKIELYSGKSEFPPPNAYTTDRGGLDHLALCVDNIFESIDYFKSKGINILKEPFKPKTDDSNQPFVSFIEGPDKQEIEIREFNKDCNKSN
ncbi:MAG: VOC family protein [Ignavibacteria bacterium]|jgi:catechol 2,3-dioxygenase-like lactoylglutathione lyase family enzyme